MRTSGSGAPLLALEGPFVTGRLLDRINRFVLEVDFDGQTDSTYLRNSGGLDTVLHPGRPVLCRPVSDPARNTAYDAIAIRVDEMWVTIDALLPNRILERCIRDQHLDRYRDHRIVTREPTLPDGGRMDFRLEGPDGTDHMVEVKSNTWVEAGVSKFPDRPTERGRRHVRSLTDIARQGTMTARIEFVVQRPDAETIRPFRSVDPAFAEALASAARQGVRLAGLSTRFDPPLVYLHDPSLPIQLE